MQLDADAEALSITRLEGSRWRGGRLWSWNRDLRAWGGVDAGAGGARATAARTPDVERAGTPVRRRGGQDDRGTPLRTRGRPRWRRRRSRGCCWRFMSCRSRTCHVSWSPERIGPMIIGAPHRGQCQAGGVEAVCALMVLAVGAGAGRARDVRCGRRWRDSRTAEYGRSPAAARAARSAGETPSR